MKNIEEKFRAAIRNEIKNIFEGKQETIDMDKVFMKGRKKKRTTDESNVNESIGGVVTTKPFGSLNEGNSYYDLKKQYYEISDNMGHGGLLSTLQDIARKKDVEEFDKLGMGAFAKEVKIWTAIHKLFNQSKLGKIL
jgi:hypothetical protein